MRVPVGERLMERHATLVEEIYPCNDEKYTMYIIIIFWNLMKWPPNF